MTTIVFLSVMCDHEKNGQYGPFVDGAHQWVVMHICIRCVQLEEITHTVQHILFCV